MWSQRIVQCGYVVLRCCGCREEGGGDQVWQPIRTGLRYRRGVNSGCDPSLGHSVTSRLKSYVPLRQPNCSLSESRYSSKILCCRLVHIIDTVHVSIMRPGIGLDNAEARPRKPSLAESPSLSGERYNASATTFFLSRDPDVPKPQSERSTGSSLPVSSLQDIVQDVERSRKHTVPRSAEARSGSRRRSTIKPGSCDQFRQSSSTAGADTVQQTPHDTGIIPLSPVPSRDVSLSGSPKSVSSRSLQRSDDGSTNDETGSQAIASGEEDEGEPPAVVQDSQPELIMPSIKMPSRRPFTPRGKRLGRFKIMVAGRQGRHLLQGKFGAMLETDYNDRCGKDVARQIHGATLRGHCSCRSGSAEFKSLVSA
jgi:hypothetical protein